MHNVHTVEIDAHEVEEGNHIWICDVTAEVRVTSGTDYGDNGLTSWGSGPWAEAEVEECTADCVRVDQDGKELETKRLEGDEAIDFVGEDELIEIAQEKNN